LTDAIHRERIAMGVAEPRIVREAVGLFRSETDLQAVVDDLLTHGFDRADLSLLASIHSLGAIRDLEDAPDVRTRAFISNDSISEAKAAVFGGFFYVGAIAALIPTVVSGGALAAALIAVGLGGGAGGTIGALLARVIGQHHAKVIEGQLAGGGLLLWVRTWTLADERRAVKILTRHSGADVHLHGLPDQPLEMNARLRIENVGTKTRVYHGQSYVVVSEKEYSYSGALFPNEDGVQDYIDRQNYLETIRSAAHASAIDLETAMLDPPSVFGTPAKLAAAAIPDPLKIEILKRWAYREQELEVAADDDLVPYPPNQRLQEIENAIFVITAQSARPLESAE
jgi:hypothetical protein